MYKLVDTDPRKEVRKRIAAEYAARDKYNRWYLLIEPYGVYYRKTDSSNAIEFTEDLNVATWYYDYSSAKAARDLLIERASFISKDLFIVVHDPRLDVFNPAKEF